MNCFYLSRIDGDMPLLEWVIMYYHFLCFVSWQLVVAHITAWLHFAFPPSFFHHCCNHAAIAISLYPIIHISHCLIRAVVFVLHRGTITKLSYRKRLPVDLVQFRPEWRSVTSYGASMFINQCIAFGIMHYEIFPHCPEHTAFRAFRHMSILSMQFYTIIVLD